MKHTTLFLMAALLLITNVHAQTEAEMKNWQEYMTPGESHKVLASMDGTWDGEVSMWMGPGTSPSKSKATTVNKMIMGGRYQQGSHTGDMMGMPFEGLSTTAFDNGKKMFISTWIDNVGTGIMVLQGKWDPATKSITLKGKSVDPSSGTGKEMDVREVLKVIDANNHVMEMFGQSPDGKEYKMMEIKYTRRK